MLRYILLIFFLVPAFAQEAPETYTYLSKDGLFTFDYPTDWAISEDLAGQISFANNDAALEVGATASGQVLGTFFTPAYLGRFSGTTLVSTPADVLGIVLPSAEYSEAASYGSDDALQAVTLLETGERRAVAFDTGNGVGLVLVDTWGAEYPQYSSTIQQIISSARNAVPLPLPLVQTFTAPDGALRFNYPARWIVTDSSEPGTYFFASSEQAAGSYVGTSGVIQGTVYPPEFLTEKLGFEPDASLLEIAVYVPQIFSQGFTFEAAIPMTVGTRSAYVTAGINGVDIESYIYIVETDKGIGLLLAAGPLVELVQYEPTFETMLATLEFDVPLEVVELAEIPADTPLTQELTLADEHLTFNYPEGWAAAETVPETAYLTNTPNALDRAIVAAPPAPGELQILILSSEFLKSQELDVKAPPLELAQTVITTIFGDMDFAFSEPFEVTFGEFTVIQWEAVNAEIETVGFLIPVRDGAAVMFCGAPSGELYAYRSILPKIAETLRKP